MSYPARAEGLGKYDQYLNERNKTTEHLKLIVFVLSLNHQLINIPHKAIVGDYDT